MSGFHLPGDPYYGPGLGIGGWIEDDLPEEQIEEDPSEHESEDDPSEDEIEEDPAEEPDENEPEPDSDNEEPELDAELWPTDEEADSEDDEEPEVVDPRYPVCDMTAPRPEPSFQVYQHPGGPRWMHTPRKSVIPCKKRSISPPASPRPTKKKPWLPLTWETQVLSWSDQQHVPSTYEVGESSRGPPAVLRTETQSVPVVPVIVERLARCDDQTREVRVAQATTETIVQCISRRVRSLEEDRNLDEEALQITRDELGETRTRLETTEARLADVEQRLAAAEQRAATAEQRTDEVHRELTELMQHLGSIFGFW